MPAQRAPRYESRTAVHQYRSRLLVPACCAYRAASCCPRSECAQQPSSMPHRRRCHADMTRLAARLLEPTRGSPATSCSQHSHAEVKWNRPDRQRPCHSIRDFVTLILAIDCDAAFLYTCNCVNVEMMSTGGDASMFGCVRLSQHRLRRRRPM